jgi:hypothetical protein
MLIKVIFDFFGVNLLPIAVSPLNLENPEDMHVNYLGVTTIIMTGSTACPKC